MKEKRVVYNVGTFSTDILRSVLENRYGELTPEDKERMEQESQQRKAEYDRTWYDTPKEDLYIGYKCEIQTSYGWSKGTWPEILLSDTLTGFEVMGPSRDLTKKLTSGCLRSKYLDKADIEECGWNWDADKDYGQKFYREVEDKYYILYTEWGDINITISEYKKGRNPEYLTKFDGECKSINELKTLMKWLNIKK